MNTKHTPGPWHVGDLAAPNLAGRNALVYAPSGYAVADAKIFHCKFGVPEMEANARLIAAAPDLLEALEAIRARIDGEWDNPALVKFGGLRDTKEDIHALATEAIAKATEKAA